MGGNFNAWIRFNLMVDVDSVLIEAIGRGDHYAFEKLVKRYQNPVMNFIYRYLGDRCTAEDLTQEVFLRVYQAAPRFNPRARVVSWVFKIAYNLSINEIRRRRRLAEQLATEEIDCEADSGSTARHELEEEIAIALESLPEKQRAALLLKVNEGLSYLEISETLGVSVASVESLLFRARKTLRKILSKKQAKQKE